MARETINGISVPIPGTGEPADFVGDLRQIATDLSASTASTIRQYAPIGSIKPDSRRAFPAAITQEFVLLDLDSPESAITNRLYHLFEPDNTGPIIFHGSLSAGVNGTISTTEAGTIDCYTADENGIAFPDAFAAGPFVQEWESDAPLLHLVGNFVDNNPYELYVDGERLTSLGIVTPVGRRHLIDWSGVSRPRHYRAVFRPGGGLAAICTSKTYAVWAPTTATPLLGVMGDSYLSTGQTTAQRVNGQIPYIIGRVLGARVAASGFGGSGYLTDSGGGQNDGLDRIARFDNMPLSGMVVMLGINDPASGLQARAEAVFARFRQAHPHVPLYVFGPWYPSAAAETTYADRRTAIAAAVANTDAAHFIDNRGWITGSGRAGDIAEGGSTAANLTGDGNADRFIGDGTHTTPGIGSTYLGLRAAHALADVIGVTA